MTNMKSLLRTATTATLALGLAVSPAWSEEAKTEPAETRDAKALEILKKADEATKKVTSARFKATSKPEGFVTQYFPAAEGRGHIAGWNGRGPEKFYGDVKGNRPGSDAGIHATGGGDGESFYVIDHIGKKGYEDMDPAVMGDAGGMLAGFGMPELVNPNAFGDELAADVVELQGEETIAGVPCYKIHVVYAANQGKSTWYLSQEDYLPRRRTQFYESPQGTGTFTVTVSDLEVNPELDGAFYRMSLPEGYEQIDDFAP